MIQWNYEDWEKNEKNRLSTHCIKDIIPGDDKGNHDKIASTICQNIQYARAFDLKSINAYFDSLQKTFDSGLISDILNYHIS